MDQILTIFLLSATTIFPYFLSTSSFTIYIPQVIALFSVIFIIALFVFRQKKFYIIFVSLIINLIIFSTGGLNSPVFFLIYFLIFTLAFQHVPSTTLAYSVVLIIFFSQSLNSLASLIPLLSILLITPLTWFIGKQYLENMILNYDLSREETDIFLWLSLKFKTGITKIINSTSILLANPQLSPSDKKELSDIKATSKYLLNSSQKLTREI